MKKLFLSVFMVLMGLVFITPEVDAKRFGGGGTSGMKRTLPARQAPDSNPAGQAPASPAATPGMAGAGAGAAAAAPRRSWMGPIAGLAAGLGLAALFSHLGMGEGLANFVMIALMVAAGFFLVRFLMRKFAGAHGPQPATQGAGNARFQGMGNDPKFDTGSASTPTPAATGFGSTTTPAATGFGSGPAMNNPGSAAAAWAAPAAAGAAAAHSFTVPAGFDVPGFERIAKMIFIRMQAANDTGDLNDLRQFTTPEMYASVRLDLQERGETTQQTDVVKLDTEVLDIARENGNQVVSVRFHGLIREDKDGIAAPFDEVWHLVKPEDGSREWAIAGVAQYA